METGQLVRMARRRTGLSQREFAALAGISERTVERWEAGRSDGSCTALARALGAADLELVAEPSLPEPGERVLHHLRSSLTMRLYRSLGGTHGDPATDRRPGPWQELGRLAAASTGPCHLVGRQSLCLWLPGVDPPTELVVLQDQPVPAKTRHLRVRYAGPGEARGDGGVRGCTVVVPVGSHHCVLAQPPAVLGSHPECTDRRRELLGVGVALDQGAAVDDAGRRAPGHREAQHAHERWQMLASTRLRNYPMPPAHDARSWRLDGDVSLGQWLRRHGIPG